MKTSYMQIENFSIRGKTHFIKLIFMRTSESTSKNVVSDDVKIWSTLFHLFNPVNAVNLLASGPS